MNNFVYHNPTRIIFGKGTFENIGKELKSSGIKKVLLLYGQQSILRNGVFDRVTGSLEQAGVSFYVLGGVQPNPLLEKVNEGIEKVHSENAEAILAVGGGSVFDSAKAIAAGVLYDGDVWDFFDGKARIKAALLVYGILTLSATGSEMNGNAVITRPEEQKKWGISSRYLYPVLSIIDPTLQATLPSQQTVNAAADILSHVFELYFDGTKDVEIMQEYSEAIIRTVMKNVKKLLSNAEDYEARAQMAWAATLALNNSNGTGRSGGDWATHDIEHSLSAFFNVAHGSGLAILTPAWMSYVYKEDIDTFARFADKIFGITNGSAEENARAGIEAYKSFLKEIGAPVSLQEIGVTADDLNKMAENAVLQGPLGRLKKLSQSDVLEIYKLAL